MGSGPRALPWAGMLCPFRAIMETLIYPKQGQIPVKKIGLKIPFLDTLDLLRGFNVTGG